MEQLMRATLGDLQNRLLKFSDGNAKLEGISNFSLPAGHACPGAFQCQSRTVNNENEKGFHVQDGAHCQFRCFAATDEAKYPAVRMQRWHNFLLLKDAGTIGAMADLIEKSLPKTWAPIRIHVSGDFFSQDYFDAWIKVAKNHPTQIFYAYTKSIPLWVKRLGQIPPNLRLVASHGGRWDQLIEKHNLKYAKVVFTVEQAAEAGLEIDHDDSHAYGSGPSFALLLHGTQPAGSPAAKAWSALKAQGIGGYHNQKSGYKSLGKFYNDKKKAVA